LPRIEPRAEELVRQIMGSEPNMTAEAMGLVAPPAALVGSGAQMLRRTYPNLAKRFEVLPDLFEMILGRIPPEVLARFGLPFTTQGLAFPKMGERFRTYVSPSFPNIKGTMAHEGLHSAYFQKGMGGVPKEEHARKIVEHFKKKHPAKPGEASLDDWLRTYQEMGDTPAMAYGETAVEAMAQNMARAARRQGRIP
jgi:hypothetical protein